ncbi:transporter substrate-binding domain-containing protein [Hyphomicrobium sp.]|uniref:transporter substrate-binding domain-containing protein n=1 Tax=Hyphomicrobium sp. TaxID=82 RepID=UPI000FA586F8|nr:transporter substrate-binding domain-containing protein [Hyphomicrobium sp.]RUP09517.1 MAG: transporter substrate-binding domain-containing protein [Hyphomicrobium sp.]
MKARKRVRDIFLAATAFMALAIGYSVEAMSGDAAPVRVAAASTPPPADAAPTRRVVIRFLTDSDFPPFNFYDEDGVLVGFNIDLARAICLELGTSCDIKARPWEELFTDLKKGEADAVIAAHKVTVSALKDVDFTDRYFHTPGRFAGRKDEPQVEMSPSGLDGKRIAVARGTAHEAFLKAFFRDSPLAIYENADLAREALAAGKADFIFDDGISLAFWLNGTLSRQCCEMRGGPYLEPKFFGDGIAIAVPKSDPGIRLLLNKALDRVRASGRFEELVQRYFPVRIY